MIEMNKLYKQFYIKFLKLIKHKKFIKQKDPSDCGAACLATVANLYNINYSTSRIRQAAGTDQKGTSAYGLVKAAEGIGFKARGVKAEIKHLNNKLQVPIIAHIIKENLLHYVVIYKILDNNLILFDPDKGLKIKSKKDFETQWSKILILLSPKETTTEQNNFNNKSKLIEKQLRKNKSLLIQIFIASLLYTGFGIIGSFYFKYLIDNILINGLLKTLHIISIGVLLISFFKVLMDTFRKHLTLYLGQQIDINLITDYIDHILTLPVSFYERRKIGEILSRIQDSGKIREALSGAAVSIMIDTILIIGGGVILYYQSKFLFKIAILLLPIYIVLVLSFANKYKKVRKKEMKKGAELQSSLVETISGVKTIKASNNEDNSYLQNEEKFLTFIEKIFKAGYLKNIQNSFDNLLAALGEIIILWAGGYQVIKGNLTIGQLITFNALLAYFYNPLQNLIKLQPSIQNASVALDRLEEIMALKPAGLEKNLLTIDQIIGNIKYENIDFIYNMKNKVLNNLSFEIKAGEKVAFVGRSGSGKTTIIKLLMKFYNCNQGNILIDGNYIEDIDTKSIRENIGYVPQSPFLFNRSILENINLNKEKYSMNKIIKAAKQAKIYDYINKLPQRFETIVEEKGNNLSGGEGQRIAIARILLKEPDLIIFDEATNHLDYKTEDDIFHTLRNIASDKTMIIIAHRLRSVINCDKIFYLKEGSIVEKGTHKKLLKKRGYYYNLWQKQND